LKNLASANVVLLARNLNPSVFSQLWLVREGIVGEKDFAEDCVFTPIAARVLTPDFQLLALPDRLQFALTHRSKNDSKLITDRVTNIVQKLEHTPYTAIGANFHWHVAPDAPGHFVEFMRGLFVRPEIPLYDEFSANDARFGAYMSKDIFEVRLKLDIRPMRPARVEKGAEVAEFLRFHFNYHLDLTYGKPIDQILDFIRKWDVMKSKSEEIVSATLNRNS